MLALQFLMLIKASKGCCNILITAATQFSKSISWRTKWGLPSLFLGSCVTTSPCQDYFKIPRIILKFQPLDRQKRNELKTAVDIEYQGYFNYPCSWKKHFCNYALTTTAAPDAPGMAEYFPPIYILLLLLQPQNPSWSLGYYSWQE